MELLITLIGGIIVTIVGGVILAEFYLWVGPVSYWFARQASRLLPRRARKRYCTEWTTDIETLPVSLARLMFALFLFAAALRLTAISTRRSIAIRFDAFILSWSIWTSFRLIEIRGSWVRRKLKSIKDRIGSLAFGEDVRPMTIDEARMITRSLRILGQTRLEITALSWCEACSDRLAAHVPRGSESLALLNSGKETLRRMRFEYERTQKNVDRLLDEATEQIDTIPSKKPLSGGFSGAASPPVARLKPKETKP